MALTIDSASSSTSAITVIDRANHSRMRSDCRRNAEAATPMMLTAKAVRMARRATSSATGGCAGHGPERVAFSSMPPLMSDVAHCSGVKKVGFALSLQLQYDANARMNPTTNNPATITTGTVADARLLRAR